MTNIIPLSRLLTNIIIFRFAKAVLVVGIKKASSLNYLYFFIFATICIIFG